MTSLRQRMIEDMKLAGLNPRTQKEYIRVVSVFVLKNMAVLLIHISMRSLGWSLLRGVRECNKP